jgi:hypothetical protein
MNLCWYTLNPCDFGAYGDAEIKIDDDLVCCESVCSLLFFGCNN